MAAGVSQAVGRLVRVVDCRPPQIQEIPLTTSAVSVHSSQPPEATRICRCGCWLFFCPQPATQIRSKQKLQARRPVGSLRLQPIAGGSGSEPPGCPLLALADHLAARKHLQQRDTGRPHDQLVLTAFTRGFALEDLE